MRFITTMIHDVDKATLTPAHQLFPGCWSRDLVVEVGTTSYTITLFSATPEKLGIIEKYQPEEAPE
jgi:hypothetical protein